MVSRDQAEDLRNLVLRAAREQTLSQGPPPRVIVFSGGKGGVGTTTLAVGLAQGLVEHGSRAILVDANIVRADVGLLCGIHESPTLTEILLGQLGIHEVLQPGPGGLLVVPGRWATNPLESLGDREWQRLFQQLGGLGRHADTVLVDVGTGTWAPVRRFWQLAREVVLVTTPENVAVMDTYATIKTLQPPRRAVSLHLLINRAASEAQARNVHQRLDHSCRRFLNQPVSYLGAIPDVSVAMQRETCPPYEQPALQAILRRLAGELQTAGNIQHPDPSRTAA